MAQSVTHARFFSLQGDRPWTQQIADSLALPPIWLALGAALLQAGACITYMLLLTPVAEEGLGGRYGLMLVANLVMALFAGYVIGATLHTRRVQAQLVDRLRGSLELDDEDFRAVRQELLAFDMPALRRTGFLALAGIWTVVLFDPSNWGPWERPGIDDPVLYWQLWANGLIAWLGGRSFIHELISLRRFSQLGARHARVDLWDPRGLFPFVQRGLHGVLLWVLAASIMSLLVIGGLASRMVPFMLVAMVGFAILAFLLPVTGVHRRMVAVKWQRLDALHQEIRNHERALEAPDSDAGREASARLPALLGLRQQLQAAREWPIDVPALMRLALYVAIGLGSWVGSAVVERLLGAALG